MNNLSNSPDVDIEILPSLEKELPLPPIDAVISVFISENQLESYLNIDPPQNGGAEPTFESLKAAVANRNVIYGINFVKLKVIAQNRIYSKNITIAQGVAPVNGIDGTYSFQFRVEKSLKPKMRPDGTVDYHNLNLIENVKKGQVLCTINLPTKGTPGTAVTGAPLLPVDGKDVPNLAGKNTELNENGTAILASINGYVEYTSNKIIVYDVLYIQENVDNSTGDVKFIGNIIVKGMVLPGFVVEAGGNIEINGTVESATLKADANIILRSGVTGSEIHCGGDLTSRFIENCKALVKGDIKAENIISSNIKCGKSLRIVGTNAKILGGDCLVGQDIAAHVIGSSSGIKTNLELGTDTSIIEKQQEILLQIPELEKQLHNLKSLISLMRQLEAVNRLTPEKKLALDAALFSHESNTQLLESKKSELAEIIESIATKGYGKIICTGTIFPGTKVTMGISGMPITELLTNKSIYYSNGDIHIGPIQ